MNYLSGKEISQALQKAYRVYLCGDLSNPQEELSWIYDNQLEIGISYYKGFTADKPHFHEIATEYNYILKGSSKFYVVNEEKEYVFQHGSLFVVPPNTMYASKHLADTQVLFVKSPGGNDKRLIDIHPELKIWLHSWE